VRHDDIADAEEAESRRDTLGLHRLTFGAISPLASKEGRMVDIASKNLWARKTRSLLTILGVAVCVMLYLWPALLAM